MERLQRVVGKTIKRNKLGKEEVKLQQWKYFLRSTNVKIDAEHQRAADEAREKARKKQVEIERQKAEARHADQLRLFAEMRKRQQEAERVAKEQRERREKEAAATPAEFWQRRETQRRERLAKDKEERRREPLRNTSCKHNQFRPKIEGGRVCGQCHQYQHRVLLQCPGCDMVACAGCQQNLKGQTHNFKR